MKFNSWMKKVGEMALPFIAKKKVIPSVGQAGSLHYVPYFGDGKSKTHKSHVRVIKKAQRRRAHYRSLRKGGG